MPHNFDFSRVDNVKTIEVNPVGWISPLFIEYGTFKEDIVYSGLPSYYWRVKGTLHTFTIPIIRMDFLSSGDYKKHFEDVLENFREDYLVWKKEGFITDWANEYYQQYSQYIIV